MKRKSKKAAPRQRKTKGKSLAQMMRATAQGVERGQLVRDTVALAQAGEVFKVLKAISRAIPQTDLLKQGEPYARHDRYWKPVSL